MVIYSPEISFTDLMFFFSFDLFKFSQFMKFSYKIDCLLFVCFQWILENKTGSIESLENVIDIF